MVSKHQGILAWKLSKARAGMLSSNCLIISHGPSPTPTNTIDKGYSLQIKRHIKKCFLCRVYDHKQTAMQYLAFTIASTVFLSCGLSWPRSVSTLLVTCPMVSRNKNKQTEITKIGQRQAGCCSMSNQN
jgi:hypothetical protein